MLLSVNVGRDCDPGRLQKKNDRHHSDGISTERQHSIDKVLRA
jgi:hypothetical protein